MGQQSFLKTACLVSLLLLMLGSDLALAKRNDPGKGRGKDRNDWWSDSDDMDSPRSPRGMRDNGGVGDGDGDEESSPRRPSFWQGDRPTDSFVPPGFEGTCDDSVPGRPGNSAAQSKWEWFGKVKKHNAFFRRGYYTCVTPGVVTPLKALVADENGMLDLSALGLLPSAGNTSAVGDGTVTLESGQLRGLLSIVPGGASGNSSNETTNTLTIAGNAVVAGSLTTTGGHISAETLRAESTIEGRSLTVTDGSFGAVNTDTVVATGDVRVGRVLSRGVVNASSVSARNANFTTLTASTIELPGVSIEASGHIICDSLSTTVGDVVAAGSVVATTSLSTPGRISGGSVSSAGDINTDTGTVSGATLVSTGDIVTVGGSIRGAEVVASGSLVGEGLLVAGSVRAETGDIAAVSGAVTGVTVSATGNVSAGGELHVGGLVRAGGSITAAMNISTVNGTVHGRTVESTYSRTVELAADTVHVSRHISGDTMSLSGDATSAAWGMTSDTLVYLPVFQGTRAMNLATLGNGKSFMLLPPAETNEHEQDDEFMISHEIVVDPSGVGRADFFVLGDQDFVDLQFTCNGVPMKGGLSSLDTDSFPAFVALASSRTLEFRSLYMGTFWTLTVTGNECLITGAYAAGFGRFRN